MDKQLSLKELSELISTDLCNPALIPKGIKELLEIALVPGNELKEICRSPINVEPAEMIIGPDASVGTARIIRCAQSKQSGVWIILYHQLSVIDSTDSVFAIADAQDDDPNEYVKITRKCEWILTLNYEEPKITAEMLMAPRRVGIVSSDSELMLFSIHTNTRRDKPLFDFGVYSPMSALVADVAVRARQLIENEEGAEP